MMTFKAFDYRVADGIAHITFNQPDRGNPFDQVFCDELNQIATECSVDTEIRCVLIDARGKYFSVGGDLKTLAEDRKSLPRFVSSATADLHMAISRFARLHAPVVASVHGLAAGGSVALIAGADFVLASAAAQFYAAFCGIGLISDTGGTYFLPRRLGSRRAAQFLLLNETLTAQQALDGGLINRVVEADSLVAEAHALARRLADGPTLAFGEIKNLLISSSFETLESQMELEARAMGRIARTDDAWNAMRSVLAKQKPTFRGA